LRRTKPGFCGERSQAMYPTESKAITHEKGPQNRANWRGSKPNTLNHWSHKRYQAKTRLKSQKLALPQNSRMHEANQCISHEPNDLTMKKGSLIEETRGGRSQAIQVTDMALDESENLGFSEKTRGFLSMNWPPPVRPSLLGAGRTGGGKGNHENYCGG